MEVLFVERSRLTKYGSGISHHKIGITVDLDWDQLICVFFKLWCIIQDQGTIKLKAILFENSTISP